MGLPLIYIDYRSSTLEEFNDTFEYFDDYSFLKLSAFYMYVEGCFISVGEHPNWVQ